MASLLLGLGLSAVPTTAARVGDESRQQVSQPSEQLCSKTRKQEKGSRSKREHTSDAASFANSTYFVPSFDSSSFPSTCVRVSGQGFGQGFPLTKPIWLGMVKGFRVRLRVCSSSCGMPQQGDQRNPPLSQRSGQCRWRCRNRNESTWVSTSTSHRSHFRLPG